MQPCCLLLERARRGGESYVTPEKDPYGAAGAVLVGGLLLATCGYYRNGRWIARHLRQNGGRNRCLRNRLAVPAWPGI